MDWTIEKEPGFRICGVGRVFPAQDAAKRITAFWDEPGTGGTGRALFRRIARQENP